MVPGSSFAPFPFFPSTALANLCKSLSEGRGKESRKGHGWRKIPRCRPGVKRGCSNAPLAQPRMGPPWVTGFGGSPLAPAMGTAPAGAREGATELGRG